jgi:hypothetical protein
MPSIMKRKLIKICHEWTCSLCECQFYNPGCVLDGLTLNGIVLQLKKMQERPFSKHVYQLHSLGAAA